MSTITEEILALKKEKNAVILAHYYVPDEVQAIADYIGDSFYLSKIATTIPETTLVFCGVSFMGESAKILNPEKTVLMPDATADCPMAHMALPAKIQKVRETYEDVAVVCYINSTAELKTYADVCVTSANALKIVKALPNKNIFFIPDENLGRYVASKLPEKNFIFNDGFCPIHAEVTVEDIIAAKEKHPDAEVVIHPECRMDVLAYADYIGSTSGIIDYVTNTSKASSFLVVTEMGVAYELRTKNPDKEFYPVRSNQTCPDMKLITLEKVWNCLKTGAPAVELTDELRNKSRISLNRMLELGK